MASELGKALAQRGHKVHFIGLEMPYFLNAHYHENIFFHQVEVLAYPLLIQPPYSLALASKMAEVAQWEKLDIIHAHYAIPHAACALLAREMLKTKRPLKVVTTLHGTDITLVGRHSSFFPITQFSIEQSDGVTCVSQWLNQRTVQEFKVQKEIETIYNFVDLGRFQRGPCGYKPPHLSQRDEKIVVHVSNFRPVKNITQLIQLFSLIQKEVPSLLLLIGDGPERQRAMELVRQLSLEGAVEFLGVQDRVERFLSCADLFLLMSESESFGLAVLEAMACQVPVVAYRVGGLPEVIEDGASGFLVGKGDIEGFLSHALKVLKESHFARSMGLEGRRVATEKFNPEDIVSQYERLYQRVLEAPGA